MNYNIMGNFLGPGGDLGGMMAVLGAFLFLFVLLGIGRYVYLGFAFMAIGKKAKLKTSPRKRNLKS